MYDELDRLLGGLFYPSVIGYLKLDFFVSFDCSSETVTRGPVSKENASDVALLIARFINSCDAGQIRLASEKCNHRLFEAIFYLISVILSLGEMLTLF